MPTCHLTTPPTGRPAPHWVRRVAPARVVVASLLASAITAHGVGFGPVAAGAAAVVERAQSTPEDAALDAATIARQNAERHLAAMRDQLDALSATVDAKFAGAAALSDDIETARRDLRRSAITAYIAGGRSDEAFQVLAASDLVEASGRRAFATSRTVDVADALATYEALKRDNDPELVTIVEEREALASLVADADDAVYQARATEADAERAVEAAAAARAAAAAEAERRRVASAQAATAAAPNPTAPTRQAATAPAAAPAGSPPTTVASGRRDIVPLTEPSAPLPDLPPGGPSEEAWAQLRRCESGGNYRAVSRSGRYRGAYQFDQQTWESNGGRGDPAAALPIEQDARARLLFSRRGARAWPHCGRALVGA